DGLRIGFPDRRAAPLRVRIRSVAHLVTTRDRDARVRTLPHRLQYKSVSLVQTGLVLFAVCDDCAGVRWQGVDSVEPGRTEYAHLQSVRVYTHSIFSGPDSDWHEQQHMGSRHRHHAVLSAAHVPVSVPGGAAGATPVRCDDDDDGGGADNLSVWPVLLRG